MFPREDFFLTQSTRSFFSCGKTSARISVCPRFRIKRKRRDAADAPAPQGIAPRSAFSPEAARVPLHPAAFPRISFFSFSEKISASSVLKKNCRAVPARMSEAAGMPLPRKTKKRSRGKIRRERFMKPKRKRLKRRAVRRERLREPALLPLRERRLLSTFWL